MQQPAEWMNEELNPLVEPQVYSTALFLFFVCQWLEHSNIACSAYSEAGQSWEAAQHCSFDGADLFSVSLTDSGGILI